MLLKWCYVEVIISVLLFNIEAQGSQGIFYPSHSTYNLQTSVLLRGKSEKLKQVNAWKKYKNYHTRAPDNETVSAETVAKRALLRQQRVKKKKFAMLLAYAGQQYYGFQKNTGVKTVEDDLLRALLQAGCITDEMFHKPGSMQFVRASRTDKGVSAVGQVVSLKLPGNASTNEINKHLPQVIRVITLVNVTKGFNSRKFSNARTYSYTMPTFAFTPNTSEHFRLSEFIREQINTILSLFQGTHSYHNFTSGRIQMTCDSFRTIMSFICCETFIAEGMEFIMLKIKGQSFMFHQIRKMVGLVVSIMRGLTNVETLKRALGKELLSIPLAPSVGLLLEQVHYDNYNKKYGNDGVHSSLDWTKWSEEIDLFRKSFISPIIFQAETKDKSMRTWLKILREHNFTSPIT